MARKKINAFTAASTLAGADIMPISQDGAGGLLKVTLTALRNFFTPFSLGFSLSGVTTQLGGAGEVIPYVFTEAADFLDDFSGSRLKAQTAATASTVFTIRKNGSSIGTITVAASGTTGTFVTTGGATSFAIGDTLEIKCPDSPDATLANIGITFKGART